MEKHPDARNAPGDFYVGAGECITCGAPEHEAPDLIHTEDDGCYFFKQPRTPEELERAVRAVCVSCCGAVRYGGEDQTILDRLEQLERKSPCNVEKTPWWKFW